ncbi:MAG: flagellar biosynthetic protein FliO [Rheinheimera sp.]|uniref:flagellar biosynthetic protein FliO n=1 Tax=Arsukibacterium sp. UBA3155 TaxID=1946058 RepID=UPI000C8AD91D|nr:flagellar biosynthetic protein FliO [Arsukibacterium sp. UBA3155]MAD74934.1 flagellar biosynthetic protein FliO [Rheinheimera sp.]|tara:strand:- start:174173 stop:174757 length:585 start_codon:yes stop_codon:yes gene_type:complete
MQSLLKVIAIVAIVLLPLFLASADAQTPPPEPQQQETAAQNASDQDASNQKSAASQREPVAGTLPEAPGVAVTEPRQGLPFQRQEVPAERKNTSGISLGKIAISLAAVLLLVVGLGWLFKKLTLRLPGSQHVKVICSVPLGQRERLLVIEIQGKQRVIGVTPHSINMLFELENSLPETKLASDFHTQLQSFLKK